MTPLWRMHHQTFKSEWNEMAKSSLKYIFNPNSLDWTAVSLSMYEKLFQESGINGRTKKHQNIPKIHKASK